MSIAQDLHAWFRQDVEEKAGAAVGGVARLKVLVLLACVLGLDSADKATVGAVGFQLKHAFHVGNVDIGLLVTVSTAIGALATLPMGVLTDRVHRTKLLAASIVVWSAAMAVSGAANSYLMLLVTRLALGAVIATAAPVIASLTGDFFNPGERGRIWGYILCGELFGAGFGILVSGDVAAMLSWRASFWVLAAISLVLAAAVWWLLPEPERGGRSRLRRGKKDIPTSEELHEGNGTQDQQSENGGEEDEVEEKVEKKDIDPHESLILEMNPTRISFWHAVRHILAIRTNVLLIIASACGYFFFTGLRTFAVIFLRGRFDLGQGTASTLLVALGVGAIIGVLITGRVADRLIGRGYISARIMISAAAFLITAGLFFVGLFTPSLYIASVLFFLAAAALGGTNPPLDAARLDIMHSRLWGRAESVRTTLRYSFEAVAPIVFGWVSTLFGGQGGAYGQGAHAEHNTYPLDHTFMVMLIPVVIAGLILLKACKPYPRDVATVLASEEATRE